MPLKEKAKRLCARLACCSGQRQRPRKGKSKRKEALAAAPSTSAPARPEAELYDALWSPQLDSHCRTCLACYAARCLGQPSREGRCTPLPSHFTL